ncbi:hypothetical protein HK102_011214, partial [Quaeritorhiza haematococci]
MTSKPMNFDALDQRLKGIPFSSFYLHRVIWLLKTPCPYDNVLQFTLRAILARAGLTTEARESLASEIYDSREEILKSMPDWMETEE